MAYVVILTVEVNSMMLVEISKSDDAVITTHILSNDDSALHGNGIGDFATWSQHSQIDFFK